MQQFAADVANCHGNEACSIGKETVLFLAKLILRQKTVWRAVCPIHLKD